MSESKSHKRAKSSAAGKSGQTEKRIGRNRRVDAATKSKATEIERSGTSKGLEKAANRLKQSRKRRRVLQVPQRDMGKANQAMKKTQTRGSVKNMSSTKRRSVSKKK
jgi:hypothetical protein